MVNREPNINVPPQVQVVSGRVPVVAVDPDTAVVRDRIHWGPVWGGLMTAVTSFMVMMLFLFWIGAISITLGPGRATIPGPNVAWVSVIVALIAFFLGGWLASGTRAVRGTGSGLMHGFIVWALGNAMILAFSSVGSGLFFGAIGDAYNRIMLMGRGLLVPTGVNAGQVASAFGAAAGWGLLFLVVTLITACLGGMAGDRAAATVDTGTTG